MEWDGRTVTKTFLAAIGALVPAATVLAASLRSTARLSKRNIFVGDFNALTRLGLCRLGAVLFRFEHPKIAGDDLKTSVLLAVLFPFARLDPALDKNQRAFFQILLRDLRLLSPHDDPVPLGALLLLAVFVFVRLIRLDREIRNRLTSAGEFCFRITGQPSNQRHSIDHSFSPSYPLAGTPSPSSHAKLSCARA